MAKIIIESFKTELQQEVTREEFEKMKQVHGNNWKIVGEVEAPAEVKAVEEKKK